ncbi:hypothetical protein K438DRAFT_1979103 [Mycena galopus ATCC 62051]|nr:hypothetical protein K438DRAFT_1979103 [Mycena galopus ATCC 62051]
MIIDLSPRGPDVQTIVAEALAQHSRGWIQSVVDQLLPVIQARTAGPPIAGPSSNDVAHVDTDQRLPAGNKVALGVEHIRDSPNPVAPVQRVGPLQPVTPPHVAGRMEGYAYPVSASVDGSIRHPVDYRQPVTPSPVASRIQDWPYSVPDIANPLTPIPFDRTHASNNVSSAFPTAPLPANGWSPSPVTIKSENPIEPEALYMAKPGPPKINFSSKPVVPFTWLGPPVNDDRVPQRLYDSTESAIGFDRNGKRRAFSPSHPAPSNISITDVGFSSGSNAPAKDGNSMNLVGSQYGTSHVLDPPYVPGESSTIAVTEDLVHLAATYFGPTSIQLSTSTASSQPSAASVDSMNAELMRAMRSTMPADAQGPHLLAAAAAPIRTVYLQDLEMQTTKYNPNAKCEVFDPALQDPVLSNFYQGLPPLRKCHIHPSFVQNGSVEDKEIQTGGQVRFSTWPKSISDFSLLTLCSAMTFTEHGKYINPARISPARVSVSATKTGSGVMRLNIGGAPAICLAAGASFESYLLNPRSTGGNDPWMHKFISVILHSQDWERWEAFFCQCFGHARLYTNLTAKAVHFNSVFVKASSAPNVRSNSGAAPSGLLSPVKQGGSYQSSSGSAYSLFPSDKIPIYNAMNSDFDFTRDISNYAALPLWEEEEEIGQYSFVVVGYSATCYLAKEKKRSSTDRTPALQTLGCNILFVILCGKPRG